MAVYLPDAGRKNEDKIKNLKASLGSWELCRLLGKITVLKRFNRISTCLRIVTSVNRPEGDSGNL